MGTLHVLDLLGRSYVIELKSGERLHFISQACEFDELTGYDEEMNRRALLVTDINTASRKGKVYDKFIMDMIAI